MRTGEQRRPSLLAEAEGLRSAFPVRLVQAYARAHVGNYAAAVAFTMFMSMFPLILGLLAILGLVISDAGNRGLRHRPRRQAGRRSSRAPQAGISGLR